MPRPYMAMADPCCSGGKLFSNMDCASGCIPPPPIPCRMRATINIGRLAARPHNGPLLLKAAMEKKGSQTLAANASGNPSCRRQHDGVGNKIAGEDPGRLIGRSQRDYPRCEEARHWRRRNQTTMNVAIITETAMIQGFASGTHSC